MCNICMQPRTVVTDVNIDTVSAVIEEDRYSSIWKLVHDLHIPRMSVQHISTRKLEMKYVCLTWIPHFLRVKEMKCRCSECLENLAQISQDPNFLSRVISVDESWIQYYDPKMKLSQRCGSTVASSGWKRFAHFIAKRGQNFWLYQKTLQIKVVEH